MFERPELSGGARDEDALGLTPVGKMFFVENSTAWLQDGRMTLVNVSFTYPYQGINGRCSIVQVERQRSWWLTAQLIIVAAAIAVCRKRGKGEAKPIRKCARSFLAISVSRRNASKAEVRPS